MDRLSSRGTEKVDVTGRLTRLQLMIASLKFAFVGAALAAAGIAGMALVGPKTLQAHDGRAGSARVANGFGGAVQQPPNLAVDQLW